MVQAKEIVFLCILDFAMRGAHRFVPRIAKEGFDMGKTNVALKAANVTLVFTRPLYVSFTPTWFDHALYIDHIVYTNVVTSHFLSQK